MIRSGSARTARPTSRARTPLRCGRARPPQPGDPRAALRAIPNLFVFRPCDTVETVECWQLALRNAHAPSVLALTRPNLPQLRLGFDDANRCAAGAYEIAPAEKKDPEVSLFA